MVRARIADVAEKAGVSKTAVSFVLNGTGSIGEETRQRVLDAARELNYQPSMVARGLRMRRTGTVGVLVPDLFGPFFFAIFAGVEATLAPKGYMCFLGNANEDPSRQESVLRNLAGWRVDGVILAPLVDHGRTRPDAVPLDSTRVVFVDREPEAVGLPADSYPSVCSNNLDAAREATLHLLHCTQGPVAFIGPEASTGPISLRALGYRQAMEEAGRPAMEAVGHGDSRDIGHALATGLLDRSGPPPAFFAATNPCGLGVYSALRAHGLRVPEDVQLVVFDDADWAEVSGVTVVRTDPYQLGKTSASALLRLLLGKSLAESRMTVPARLVVRKPG